MSKASSGVPPDCAGAAAAAGLTPRESTARGLPSSSSPNPRPRRTGCISGSSPFTSRPEPGGWPRSAHGRSAMSSRAEPPRSA